MWNSDISRQTYFSKGEVRDADMFPIEYSELLFPINKFLVCQIIYENLHKRAMNVPAIHIYLRFKKLKK